MKKNLIFITGMHRSGTSYLSRALNLCGLDLGPESDFLDTEIHPNFGNPRGHWENAKVIKLNEQIFKINGGSWKKIPKSLKKNPPKFGSKINQILKSFYFKNSLAYGFKDPRFCLTLDLWKNHISKFGIVGIFRHPLKVAESLKKRNGFKYEDSLYLWKIYNEALVNHLKQNNGFLLNFDWSRKKLLEQTNHLANKIGLCNIDLSDWYSESFKFSDKTFQKFYVLPKDVKLIYNQLVKISEKNKSVKYNPITFSKKQKAMIVADLIDNSNRIYTETIKNVQKNYELQFNQKIKFIKNSALSSLLYLYYERKDLQKKFPEVTSGNLNGLIEWAHNLRYSTDKGEIETKERLSKHFSWYSKNSSKIRKQNEKIQKISNYKKILDSLQQENTNYKKSVDSLLQENSNYKKSVDSLLQENTNYKKSVDSLLQENTNYKKSVFRFNALEQENSNYKKSVDSLQQENTNYKKSVDSLQQENTNYKKSVDSLQQENTNYKKSVDSLQQENTNYKKSVYSLQQENTNYKKSVDSLQQENANQSMKIKDYKTNIEERHNERENLLNEISKFKDVVNTFEKEKDNLSQDLNESQKNEASLKLQLTETKKELDNIKYSKSFKAVRLVTSKLEKIRKKKDVLSDIKATASASKKTIENEGVGSFVNHAKQRIKRKELLLHSKAQQTTPIQLSSIQDLYTADTNYISEQKIYEQKFNVTVVIPTNSNENLLKLLVENIKSQYGLKTLQIVLVNSGKDDLKNLEKLPEVITINIKPEEFNHGKSRKLGFEKSKGEFVIFTTDDAIPASDHLFYDMCETFSKDDKLAVVTGRQIPRSDSDLMSVFSLNEYYQFLDLNEDRIITTSDFENLDSSEKRRTSQIDDVCSCYKREILSRYSFGNVKYAEDLEMGIRLVKDGYKIAQLYSTGVIHSHLRPASYYLKRGFVETKVFATFFGDHFVDFEKFNIKNVQGIFDHILGLYNALNHTIDLLKQNKTEDISEAFKILRSEIPKFYSSNSKAKSSDKSLENIFKDFSSNSNNVRNDNFLLHDYIHSLSALKDFLKHTYPNLSGIEDEFIETLYKKFGVLVGNRLGAFELFAEKQKLKDKSFEQLEKILASGV